MYDIHINVAFIVTRDWETHRQNHPTILETKNTKWQGKTVMDALEDESVLSLIRARAEHEFRNCKGLAPNHIRVFEGGSPNTTDWNIVTKIHGYIWAVTQ